MPLPNTWRINKESFEVCAWLFEKCEESVKDEQSSEKT